MPDARTHDIITVVSGVALSLPAYSIIITRTEDPSTAVGNALLFLAAHCVSGMMFSPDLDLDSKIDDRWGIFYWIWRPYMWAVPHRSRWLSHGLVFSTLLRLAYFYGMVSLILIVLTWVLGRLGIILPRYHELMTIYLRDLVVAHPRETWTFLAGFLTGGAAHTIADWLVTGGKHFLRRMGIRVSKRYEDHDRWRPRRRKRAW